MVVACLERGRGLGGREKGRGISFISFTLSPFRPPPPLLKPVTHDAGGEGAKRTQQENTVRGRAGNSGASSIHMFGGGKDSTITRTIY